ncbi:helix-turn-helix domain-containing protein [Thalassospira sp.]|uniref:helix-turn-helix domain-containing protein n=1 Tax=Thalassospira sp. TaxID=1912094 RepID=UPI001B000FF2|nr:helix-turn-helix domain-containing protein [Thalassospira sp.]MBO6808423.1 helix-turn-helix domain-containing protein [Thalassospira sp.]MBO6839879.1 helix-turn-helix domain-containing protein [Thalassospira sp.]
MVRKHDKSPQEIRFELNQKGLTFADVDRASGFRVGTTRDATRHPHAEGEQAIAEALGLRAKDIWPSRYDAKGKRLKPQPSQNYTDRPRLRHCLKEEAA